MITSDMLSPDSFLILPDKTNKLSSVPSESSLFSSEPSSPPELSESSPESVPFEFAVKRILSLFSSN